MTPEALLVEDFGKRGWEVAALQGLTGGVSATHLRSAKLTDAAFTAVTAGLTNVNPRVRWWCIQVLDHIPDARAINAIAALLNDPVPRVRRNAAHSLGCIACKPNWNGELSIEVLAKLQHLSLADPSPKVRAEASAALACRSF